MLTVVGLVLLAFTTLGQLPARSLDRRKEIAVRLAWAAGAAGADGPLSLLVTADLPLPVPITLDRRLDRRVLAFTLGVSVVASALLGLLSALQSTRPDLAGALRSKSAGGGRPSQLHWRNALVVAQHTISLVLLVGARLPPPQLPVGSAGRPGFGRDPTTILTFPDAVQPASRPKRRASTRRACWIVW